ncbi:MAG: tol-pal system protein YbgF [Pseudomonadota bacterium]
MAMIIRRFAAAALGGAAIAVSAVGPVHAASTKKRVETLEQQVATMQSRLDANGGAATVRISQLETQIQDLTGKIEQLEYQLQQANARVNAMSSLLAGETGAPLDLPMGTGDFGGPGAGGPTSLAPGLGAASPADDPIADRIAAAGDPAGAEPVDIDLPSNASDAFDYASSFIYGGDYASAQAAFEAFAETFPNTALTADARFRLGEIYLTQGANAKAADTFVAHIRDYPSDPRAAEAYLKLGATFSRMNQPKEACEVFNTLKRKFPSAPVAVMQRVDAEMAKVPCR